MLVPLKLKDIRERLIDNKSEFQLLEADEYVPANGVYDTYILLHKFIEYYAYRHECEEALKELEFFLNRIDFLAIIQWIKKK